MLQTLLSLRQGEYGYVQKLTAEKAMKERFLDLGLFKNAKVLCRFGPMKKGIRVYEIGGSLFAIRNKDAKTIWIERQEQA